MTQFLAPKADKSEQDETTDFAPRFDDKGLISAIITHASDDQVLMLGYMNDESLALTLETGHVHFYSRSRGKLWKKGETSGEIFQVVEMLTDCDQDALLVKVELLGRGSACHTGRKSCFYRSVSLKNGAGNPLIQTDGERIIDPDKVYGK